MGRYAEAIGHLDRALTLGEQREDLQQQAITHLIIMGVFFHTEDFGRALDHAELALGLFRELGNPVGEGHSLNSSAWSRAHLGDYEVATEHAEAALAVYRRHHCLHPESDALDTLGYIYYRTGDYVRAVEYGERAVDPHAALPAPRPRALPGGYLYYTVELS